MKYLRHLKLNDYIYLVLLLSFLLMGSAMAISTILNVVAFILACLSILKKRNLPNKEYLALFFLLILPIIFSLATLFYSESIMENLKAVEKLLFLVLTGFAILFVDGDQNLSFRQILLLFGYTVFGLYGISILQGILYFLETNIFFHHRYSNSFLPIQHNYLSFYGIFAIVVFVRDGICNNSKKQKIFHVVISLLIVSTIFIVTSRLAILCILFGFFAYFIFEVVKSKSVKKGLLLISFLGVSVLMLFISPNTIDRFKMLGVADRSPRYLIWRCSKDILGSEVSIFKGLGAGNVQKKLDECYVEHNRKVWVGLHSHNQILGNTLSFGYFAAIILLLSFGYFVFYSITKKNYTLFFFLILIFVLGLTENYMRRRYGIFFYSFIICLLLKAKNDPFIQRNYEKGINNK